MCIGIFNLQELYWVLEEEKLDLKQLDVGTSRRKIRKDFKPLCHFKENLIYYPEKTFCQNIYGNSKTIVLA